MGEDRENLRLLKVRRPQSTAAETKTQGCVSLAFPAC